MAIEVLCMREMWEGRRRGKFAKKPLYEIKTVQRNLV
jgi:hypothetical protein